MHPLIQRAASLALCLAASTLAAGAFAQAAGSPASVRLRGTIVSVSASSMTVKDRTTGEVVELATPANVEVSETYPIALAEIRAGSFIGTAAVPQADGSQRAIAVTVFPESFRGRGEGHRPFDLLPASTMTNATVADVMAAPNGRTLQLKYKDGEKTVSVPPDAPVVTFRPGDRSLLVPGASVSLTAAQIDGKPTAIRISAGRNGFVLPY
jgi:hypothetical protein